MRECVNNTSLFQVNKDKIKYKYRNQISNITYNKIPSMEGILNVEVEPNILVFPSLSEIDFIRHGFSTRLGGVSKEHLSSMNLSFTRGDDRDTVVTNYQRICGSMGMNENDLVFTDQIHDTKIHVATEEDRGKGVAKEREIIGIDGLITNIPNLPLVTFYADCVPLYFVDTKKKAIGLSHSGWRGTVNKMGLKTVEAMTKQYGTNPKDVIAVIGPSICRDCYEVSKDVVLEFKQSFSKRNLDDILEEKTGEKYQLDLWLANKYILLEAGIPIENISISGICTCCNSTLLYSHRASQGMRGNLAAFLTIV
ncbi:hypothetical protein EDD66_103328 [Mobilisporobacter senegalensis]|uniref:Purine nucleoside phosphorylase n=1 Tax=Mobilisporobacter senegalensis TaxID=1329262 RepID=A0A3N1XRV4_9FIRM|nr:peptidoglycan editing factor PgeF [Mobilisporobacter senegalensis]ROR29390.1 hypothetical protein EDD66_103328 [Mobilisporobacter senegalensis]